MKMNMKRLLIGFVAGVWAISLWADDEMDLDPITVKGDASLAEASEEAEVSDGDAVAVEDEEASDGVLKTENVEAKEEKDEEDEALKAMDKEIASLRKERDLISMKSSIRSEKFKIELIDMKEERERLSATASLLKEQLNAELLQSKLELDRMGAEIDRMNKEMLLERTRSGQKLQTELADLKMQEERLKAAAAVTQKEMEAELATLRLSDTRLKLRRAELEMNVIELQSKLASREVEDAIGDQVYTTAEQMYLKEPYVDGTLRISDRRIAMNGIVWSGLAVHISERINYFNNESTEFPIFIVIDSSPGGSVMSGYKILKAMEGSEAPVYVVVKSYAASMAAAIATLAERSYAFPNAIVLHHQISGGMLMGNLTQQRENVTQMEQWWQRVAKPIAEKMGLSIEEFTSLMYENDSDGDWMEFADKAVEYKWIDSVVDRIWEMSIDRNPDRYGNQIMANAPLEERLDESGEMYVRLPRLDPYDVYFLHSPDGYYRVK